MCDNVHFGPPTFLQFLDALEQEQRAAIAAETERLGASLKETSGIPAGPDVIKALTRLPPQQAEIILHAHPGHKLALLRASYLTSLSIFEVCVADLLAAIAGFETEALAENSTIFNRTREHALYEMGRRIQKELFAATASAHSLVDHTRRLNMMLGIVDYDQHLRNCFGVDDLHEFVIGLRTLLHHIQIVEADFLTTRSMQGNSVSMSATFVLHKAALVQAMEENRKKFGAGTQQAIDRFLSRASVNIDLKVFFRAYSARVGAFHAWLKGEIAAAAPLALRDYDRCVLERKKAATRGWWNVLLGNWLRNWPVPPNPHDHLHRYLSDDQLRAVNALPTNSKQQVDLVITFLDTDNAITDELRALAYELFERALDGKTRPGHPA